MTIILIPEANDPCPRCGAHGGIIAGIEGDLAGFLSQALPQTNHPIPPAQSDLTAVTTEADAGLTRAQDQKAEATELG